MTYLTVAWKAERLVDSCEIEIISWDSCGNLNVLKAANV